MMVSRAILGVSIQAVVVISPMTRINPVVVAVSQATRASGSFARIASSTASDIWSHSLSGCPSVTDSDVRKDWGEDINVDWCCGFFSISILLLLFPVYEHKIAIPA